jgi:thiosulfate/3-mercaptopyruvate sulfurtransferase
MQAALRILDACSIYFPLLVECAVSSHSIGIEDHAANILAASVDVTAHTCCFSQWEKEFNGEDIRALRGGHIPGAVNIPYEANWIDPDTAVKLARKQVSTLTGMSLKAVADLRALYANLDPEKETVVYCQSGARASETAGVLQQLGFKNVKVYDSSWIGYGNTLDAPANNVTYFNAGALNGRITAMQNKIDALEKTLADERAKR